MIDFSGFPKPPAGLGATVALDALEKLPVIARGRPQISRHHARPKPRTFLEIIRAWLGRMAWTCRRQHPLSYRWTINLVQISRSFAGAEEAFGRIRPYLPKANTDQIAKLLTVSNGNTQVYGAWGCQNDLKELLRSFGKFLPAEIAKSLGDKLTPPQPSDGVSTQTPGVADYDPHS